MSALNSDRMYTSLETCQNSAPGMYAYKFKHNYYLFLEHDAHNEIITVEKTERGVRLKDRFTCDEILSSC